MLKIDRNACCTKVFCEVTIIITYLLYVGYAESFEFGKYLPINCL